MAPYFSSKICVQVSNLSDHSASVDPLSMGRIDDVMVRGKATAVTANEASKTRSRIAAAAVGSCSQLKCLQTKRFIIDTSVNRQTNS